VQNHWMVTKVSIKPVKKIALKICGKSGAISENI